MIALIALTLPPRKEQERRILYIATARLYISREISCLFIC